MFLDSNGNVKIYIAKVPMADNESIIDLPGKLVSVNDQKFNSSNVLGLYFHQCHDLSNVSIHQIMETIINKHSDIWDSRVQTYEIQIINIESRNKIIIEVCFFF